MANESFQDKVSTFMRGRNGADELTIACVWLAVILAFINLFVGQLALTIVVLVILAYAFFRMTSKSVAARRRESEAFASHLGPVRPWIRNPGVAFEEARAYKHGSCPECSTRVRVPRGKGHLRVTCPHCGKKFEMKS